MLVAPVALAVSLMAESKHIVSTEAIVTVGEAFTVTVLLTDLVQPRESVTVTVVAPVVWRGVVKGEPVPPVLHT